jgi:hypothetical protein
MPEIRVVKDQSRILVARGRRLQSLASEVLPGWLLALLGSALITAAGRRWPAALPIQPLLALALVLVPPLLLLLWLLLAPRRPLPDPCDPDRGESGH